MGRPKRKLFFFLVAESEKVKRHIQKTKQKATALNATKSLMFLVVNQVLINLTLCNRLFQYPASLHVNQRN